MNDQSFAFGNYGSYSPGARDLTSTGSNQSTALPLLRRINHFGSVPNGTGCMLPQSQSSSTTEVIVINRGGGANLLVYPPYGGTIENLYQNQPFSCPVGTGTVFLCFDSVMQPGKQWSVLSSTTAPTILTGGPDQFMQDTPPANPQTSDIWWDSVNGHLYMYYNDGTSTQWIDVTGGAALPVVIQDMAPTNPKIGQIWYCSADGQTYLYYDDVNSSQWVPLTNQDFSGAYFPANGTVTATGAITPRTLPDHFADVVYARDFGAIFDGNSHPLSATYSTLAAAQAVYPFAVALTDEIDGTAIQAALNFCAARSVNNGTTGVTGGGTVVMPQGIGRVNRPLTINTSNVSLKGAMPGFYVRPGGGTPSYQVPSCATQLLWTGAARTTSNGPINVLTVTPTVIAGRRLSGTNLTDFLINCNQVAGAGGVLILSNTESVLDLAVVEPATIAYPGTVFTAGSQNVTIASTTGMTSGTSIVSAHLPNGTYVKSVTDATHIVASAQATGSATETCYVGGVGIRFDVLGGLGDVNDTQYLEVRYRGQSILGAAGTVAPHMILNGSATTGSGSSGNAYGNTSLNFFSDVVIWQLNGVGAVLCNCDHNFFRNIGINNYITSVASMVLNGSSDPNNGAAVYNVFQLWGSTTPAVAVGTNTGGFTAASQYNQFPEVPGVGNIVPMPTVGTGATITMSSDNYRTLGMFYNNNNGIAPYWPDNTSMGGNGRGSFSVDLQTSRNDPTQVASGINTVIAGGAYNIASGASCVVSGGFYNHATGNYSYIPGGQYNIAAAPYSMATGLSANADLYCARVHANDALAAGKAGQQYIQILKGVSAANTTPVRLTADGAAAGAVNVMNATYGTETITLSVQLAASDGNNFYSWAQPMGMLRRNGGVGAMVYTPGTPTSAGNGTTTGIAITEAADTTNGGYSLTFTPPTGNTAIWKVCATVTATRCDG